MEFFAEASSFWLWLSLAGILLIIELMVVPSGFLLLAAAAAGCVAVAAFFFKISLVGQFIFFAALILVATWVWWRFIFKPRGKREPDNMLLNARKEQMIGYKTVLAEPVINGKGRIKVNDSSWPVVAAEDYPAGTRVEVVEVESITLTIRSVK